MQLSQHTDYAFRILIYLGTKTKLVRISDISDAYGISFNHLTKTVHELVQLGFIESKQGRNGGIKLAMAANKINLRKIVEKMENKLAIVECLGPSNTCVISSGCLLKGILKSASESFLKELGKFTLEDILTTRRETLTSLLKQDE